jgi:hypothetical protein
MTAAPAASQALGDRQLLPTLQTIHGQWLQNAHKMLESARRSEAGILCRSAAVRSLNTDLSPRLHLERALVESVGQMVEPPRRRRTPARVRGESFGGRRDRW